MYYAVLGRGGRGCQTYVASVRYRSENSRVVSRNIEALIMHDIPQIDDNGGASIMAVQFDSGKSRVAFRTDRTQ
jgi:hypothetical protein